MEQTNPKPSLGSSAEQDTAIETPVILSSEMLDSLDRMIYWAKFLSIVGFVAVGLLIFGMLTIIFVGQSVFGAEALGLGFIYLVLAAVYFMPVYYLFKFARHGRLGLQSKSQHHTDQGLMYLAAHYKFIGILVVVMLSLYALVFIGILATGFSALSALSA